MSENFTPTWLYIKQHNKTGLKYFGKTIRKNPITYVGSGVAWRQHLAEHGSDITTIWCQLFTSKDELVNYAVKFSLDNNIVDSAEWANLMIEEGLGSRCIGRKDSPETIEKRRLKNLGKKRTPEQRKRMSESQKSAVRKKLTEEQKVEISQKISNALKGRKTSEETKLKLSKINKGKNTGPRSEKTKEKMRKPKSPEHRKAISEGRKGKKFPKN